MLGDKGVDLRDGARQFFDNRAAPGLAVGINQSVVVPEGPLFAAREPLPEFVSQNAVVGEDGAGVVQLVGG